MTVASSWSGSERRQTSSASSYRLLLLLLLSFAAAPPAAAGQKQMKCPSQDFAVFSRAFSESVDIQKSFTNYRLSRLRYVDDSPEPREQEDFHMRSQLTFPLVPNAEHRAKLGWRIAAKDVTDTLATLELWKDDTDWSVVYIFEKRDCWYLSREEDHSL